MMTKSNSGERLNMNTHDLSFWLHSQACQETVLRFMALFDLRNWSAMENLVTPDVVWQRPDLTIDGIAQLKQVLNSTPQGVRVRHIITNLRCSPLEHERMVVESYFTVYRDTSASVSEKASEKASEIARLSPETPSPLLGPVSVGRYTDELMYSGGEWRIHKKNTLVDFRQAPR